MSLSLQTELVLISPLYGAVLDLWRRSIGQSDDVGSNTSDVSDIIERLDAMEERLDDNVATSEDIEELRGIIDALHEDAEIIHDNVIDHNPCVYQRATGDCPFCTPPEDKD